ncbi:SinI family autotransporter-associated protein [Yersinia intermedia]|uniref:SinI family autotransporter-associated protein n=1 Tax=Yersinia intermedia TaxID=631 RepID=UPI0022FEF47A|nr:SinI family autotransporter-associated protein [Yersinia intermedia]MDA5483425.1 SinI family autotransporter-associated protein [Yersinia intermedia]
MKMHFAVKKIALALALAGCSISPSWAASTGATTSVKGTPPVLSAPSSGVSGTIDFSGVYANAGQLTTGDQLVMSYNHVDTDGDADDSLTTVIWSYAPAGGGADIPILGAVNVPAGAGTPGTSTITLPGGAMSATAIKMTLQERSATGDPLTSRTFTVTDTSAAGGAGGGGGIVTPPGPVLPGIGIAGGIFLASASPTAGSGAADYSRTAGHPQVGDTFVFRAWADTNGNGTWEAGEADVTASLSSIQWQLDGTNTSASGTGVAATLSNHSIPGATTDTYTVPVNSASGSGAAPGDQGFNLKVDFN